MDRSKKILLIVIIILIVCFFAMRGCVHIVGKVMNKVMPATSLSYDHPERYSIDSIGGTTLPITDIKVEWINGDIHVLYGDIDSISWCEIYTDGTPSVEDRLHYYIEDNTLAIRYCAPHFEDQGHLRTFLKHRPNKSLHKELTIILPRGAYYNNVEISGINGNHFLDIDACEMDLSMINGSITLSTRQSDNIQMQTINGNLTIFAPDTSSIQVTTDKVNGAVYTEWPCSQQDNIYTCGVAPYMRIEMDVINGNMNILKLK